MSQDKLPEPGEFTRMFKRHHLAGMGSALADSNGGGETSGIGKAEESGPGAPEAFPNPQSVPPKDEPGAFTGDLPAPEPRSNEATSQRNSSGVQRPNSPVAPRTLSGESSGSFAARFGNGPAAPLHKVEEFGVHNSRLGLPPDLSKPVPREEDGPFDFKLKIPQAPPSKEDNPGEYTALFGKGSVPPLPRQAAPAETAAPATNSGIAAPAKVPVNLQLPPLNPISPSGSMGPGMHPIGSFVLVGMQEAHLNSPVGGVNVQGPRPPAAANALPLAKGLARVSDRPKLLLFFALLAILFIVLVVSMIATQKS